MTAEQIRCPFGPCEARFDAPQQYLSGPRGGVMLDYVPNHQFVPDAWFGGCPASAMQLPIAEYERDALREQERNHARIAASKVPRLREQTETPAAAPPPQERPVMFRPTGSQGSRDLGPQAHPNRLLPHPEPRDNPVTAQTGGTMTSVSEIRAAIAQANALIAEAQATASLAAEKFRTARDSVAAIVASSSVDPLSIPTLSGAVEATTSAMQLSQVAIEINNTFEVGL